MIKAFIGSVALVMASFSAVAQTSYPQKPVRLMVGAGPGGGTDIIARETCQRVASATGWSFVIDNKPGAGGNLGVDAVAKSPADGYTLVLGQTSNIAINPSLYGKLPYDPIKDLTPVAVFGSSYSILGISSKVPATDLASFLAYVRSKPGVLNWDTWGPASIPEGKRP